MEFVFEQSPWDLLLDSMHRGDKVSAVQVLSLMEDMSEEEAEEALLALEEKGIALDISGLPLDNGSGEMAVRLRYEQQLALSGQLLEKLENNDPLHLYLQELAEMPATGDKAVFAKAYLNGDDAAAQQLAALSLSLVTELAMQATGHGVLLMDLIQEGSLGLWQGILNYTQGDFDAHIQWWISQYISKAVFMQARSGEIGTRLRQGMADFQDADRQLLAELGRNPTLEEIAEAIHVTPEEATVFANTINQARFRQRTAQQPEQENPDDAQAVENTAYFQTRQKIAEMLSVLSSREAELLTLRFGLEGGLPQTPEQIGKAMGMTPDEVVNMEAAALLKLRQQSE